MLSKGRMACILMLAAGLNAAVFDAVIPKNGVPPIGPYSPGTLTGEYLYVSGQGAKRPDGQMPSTFEEQVKQTIVNVQTVVQAAGLSLENVVYTQVYLDDMAHYDAMNKVYRQYFSKAPPARATLGVSKLPGGTPVEINAVAVRRAEDKRAVSVPGFTTEVAVSPGILTQDRLFVSTREVRDGREFVNPAEEVNAALDGFKDVVRAAGVEMTHVVFVNPYLTSNIPMKTMNELYAKRFEFGNTPARATIDVTSLPMNANIAFTGVAVRDLTKRLAVRPKNMPPSPTASPCVFAGETLYCSAKSGFIPGAHGGIFSAGVDQQMRQTMRNLLDNLEEAGLGFEDVVASNVYLNDVSEFGQMNSVYSIYFQPPFPARTTIQQVAPISREKSRDDTYPTLEQVSIVAVKPRH